jgi:hypothetical protein
MIDDSEVGRAAEGGTAKIDVMQVFEKQEEKFH